MEYGGTEAETMMDFVRNGMRNPQFYVSTRFVYIIVIKWGVSRSRLQPRQGKDGLWGIE